MQALLLQTLALQARLGRRGGDNTLTVVESIHTCLEASDLFVVQALAATMKPPCGPEDLAPAVMRRTFPG